MIDSLIRAIPYVVVAFILLCLFFIDDLNKINEGYKKRRLILVGYCLLLFFFGLRGFVMTDFVSYYPFFNLIENIDSIPEIVVFKGWEPGYVVFSFICKSLIPNYFAWNLISCAIDLYILYLVLNRYSYNHFLSLIVFFIVGALPLEMNVLRNAKAIFIFLLAIKYIEEQRFIPYLLLILLAMTFHVSAVLYLPCYFILGKKWPQWVVLSIFILGCIILFSHISILSSLINHIPMDMDEDSRGGYLISHHLSEFDSYGLSFGTIERIITYVILMIIYERCLTSNNTDIVFYNLFFLLFVVYFYFSESHVVVQRLQYLFIPCFWIVYPSLFRYLKCIRLGAYKTIFIMFLIIKVFLLGAAPENRYENILFGIDSFEKRHDTIEF